MVASAQYFGRMHGGALAIGIREVVTNRDLYEFIRFPFRPCQDHPYRVPALELGEVKTLQCDNDPASGYREARSVTASRDGCPVVGIRPGNAHLDSSAPVARVCRGGRDRNDRATRWRGGHGTGN